MEYHFAGAREWKRIAHRRHAIAHDSVIDARALSCSTSSQRVARHLKCAKSMRNQYRQLLLMFALIVLLVTPLWFDGGLGPERVVAQGLESMTLPVAAIVRKPVSAEQLEASRLLMAGTMLFGLAAVVRRAM